MRTSERQKKNLKRSFSRSTDLNKKKGKKDSAQKIEGRVKKNEEKFLSGMFVSRKKFKQQ